MKLLLVTLAWFVAEWPQFLGPERNGNAEALAVRGMPRPQRVWRAEIGTGYSAPVVAGGVVYAHSRRGGEEVVTALDWRSGKTIWQAKYKAPFRKNAAAMRMQDGPFATPLVHQGRLYTWGVSGILTSFDAKTGAVAWRLDDSARTDTGGAFCGHAASPLMEGGRLIVLRGDDRAGTVTALDPATGKPVWEWKNEGIASASPSAGTIGGVRQIVAHTTKAIVGLEAATGRPLWSFPFTDQWNEIIMTPLVAGERVLTSGVRAGTYALMPRKTASGWTVKTEWHNPAVTFYLSNPVLDGEYLYGLSNRKRGQYVCVDTRTGSLKWESAGRDAQSAGLIRAGGRLLVVTTDGDLVIAPVSAKGFEPIGRAKVADTAVWAYPLLVDEHLLVKDETGLTVWRL